MLNALKETETTSNKPNVQSVDFFLNRRMQQNFKLNKKSFVKRKIFLVIE